MDEREVRPEAVRLYDMVCFNLQAANRAVTAAYRPLLEPLGITYAQYLVLAVLWEEGDIPVGDLVGRLQSDYGTMTPLLKRLEGAGLIRRERNPADERSVTVILTDEGRALSAHAQRIYSVISETFDFSEERATDALELLRSITASTPRAQAPGGSPGA
jgi:DNA-binding MarR family transcriptional regulator